MYHEKDISDSVTICMYIALKCVIRIIDQVRWIRERRFAANVQHHELMIDNTKERDRIIAIL